MKTMNEPKQNEMHAGNPSPAEVPAFSPGWFRTQLRLDGIIRALLLAGLVIAMFVSISYEENPSFWWILPFIFILATWLSINSISARTSRLLPQLTLMVETNPTSAEPLLAYHLRYRPLFKWLRLMLYHRLAMLRHRQGRFEEVSRICGSILSRPLGPAEHLRPHLLLLYTESRLERGDLSGAYHGLVQLYWTKMNLIEALQRLALQTRYEVMAGYYQAAIQQITRKVHMAEIMPPHQCGHMHAMLATAANAASETELAHWLWERAKLLCTSDRINQFYQARFSSSPVNMTTNHMQGMHPL